MAFSGAGYGVRFASFDLCAGEDAEVDPILVSGSHVFDLQVLDKVARSAAATETYAIDTGDQTQPHLDACF